MVSFTKIFYAISCFNSNFFVNILIISGFYHPYNNGGPSNTSYWMAKALGAEGCNVKVVALHHSDLVVADKWIKTDYGSVIYITYKNVNLAFQYIKTAIAEARHADIIHLNSLFAPTSFLIGFISAFKGKRIYWSPRGELSQYALAYSSLRKKLQLLFLHKVKNRLIFHATSEQEKIDILKTFGSSVNVIVIPNLIELNNSAIRQTEDYFLFVGRIHPIKRLDNLIDAFAGSKSFRSSTFKLKIAGSNSPYLEVLQEKVKQLSLTNKILFVGHYTGLEKEKLYANAYYLVLPSDSENFGNVVVESLAQGTPVIASKGTPWQSLELNNAGFWVDNSVACLTEVIERALSLPPEFYNHQRHNARELVESQFDIKIGIQQWIRNYTLQYA